MRFRLWLEDDLEDRLQGHRGVPHTQQRSYGPEGSGYHPDTLLVPGALGYSFFYNYKDGRVHLGPIGDRHVDISTQRTGGRYMLGGITGRIRLPNDNDNLYNYKTDIPLISFWNNDEEAIQTALNALLKDPEVARIPNIQNAFVVVGGYYRGRANQFIPQADNQEMVNIGGQHYRLRDLPATVHSLPPGEHKQAVINYICSSDSPILANYKHMCSKLASKSIDLRQKFYATQGD